MNGGTDGGREGGGKGGSATLNSLKHEWNDLHCYFSHFIKYTKCGRANCIAMVRQ